eukprot:1185549-Prorocentrum_minimum.AAC.1
MELDAFGSRPCGSSGSFHISSNVLLYHKNNLYPTKKTKQKPRLTLTPFTSPPEKYPALTRHRWSGSLPTPRSAGVPGEPRGYDPPV